MGIKGIYGEIGSGNRVALQKLAIDKFEKTGRPLRIAIDISIWQFQIQSGRGGTNPAIRTLYYRLLRLLSISVQPLFVFDGPHKPTFKRNKRVGANGGMLPNMLTKQLLKLFGFPFHVAPGEAEAECALLQREGIVDAVLSEDVDTLMFGCGWTFRNWSSEGVRGNKSPTHVSAYEAEATKKGKSGLDREGMILVALMSGGDYITEGIPGCGIKVACEAARAGFGKSLCQISRSDPAALETWRIGLAHEIQTNEGKFFRVKHKALKIPENFPDSEVLGYYTHPVVSSTSKIEKLKNELSWDGELDILGLRQWVAEVFEWKNKGGATKFIRGLAPALLIHKLRLRADRRESGYGDLVLTAMQEMELVRSICGNRVHFSTGGIRELRVVFAPLDIVDIDLEAEYDDSGDYGRDGLAPVMDDDMAEPYISDDAGPSTSPSKRGPSLYDPTQLEKVWIPATIVKVGIPLKAEDYEETLRNPKKPVKAKTVPKKTATKKSGMPKGALDKFVKVTKEGLEGAKENPPEISKKTLSKPSQVDLPPVYLAPLLDRLPSSQASVTKTNSVSTRSRPTKEASIITKPAMERTQTKPRVVGKSKVVGKPRPAGNPWTLSQSCSSQRPTPSITKPLGQQAKTSKEERYDVESSLLASSQSSSLASTLRRKPSPSPEPDAEVYSEPDLPSSSPPRISVGGDQPRSFSDGNTIDQPSPRKKRTPEQVRDLANGLQTFDLEKSPTPHQVNRRLDFSPHARDRSSSPELPTLIQLFTPKKSQISAQTEIITISSSPEVTKTLAPKMSWNADTQSKKLTAKGTTVRANDGKKYIMLRESLPGAWTEAGEKEGANSMARGRSWRASGVEVLDLTED